MSDGPQTPEPITLSLTLGELPVDPVRVVRRQAVRAVIRRGEHLLMVHSRAAGDFKFPGGGIEAGESPAEALTREVREECGVAVVHLAGTPTIVVEERRPGLEAGAILSMRSSYHECVVDHDQDHPRDLDPYEADLGFEPAWVTVDDAVRGNEEVRARGGAQPWVARELAVLRVLRGAAPSRR
jgi:8-oxo-dGTP pyrophosphatase MutT (NUDIX family)